MPLGGPTPTDIPEGFMKTVPSDHPKPIYRVGLFIIFSHMRPMVSKDIDLVGGIFLISGFLFVSLPARRSEKYGRCRQILFAWFIASTATTADYYLPSRDWLMKLLNLSLNTPAGLAIVKLDSSIIIVVSIVLFTKLSGAELSSLYLPKGSTSKGYSSAQSPW
jgi:hypothetical protein